MKTYVLLSTAEQDHVARLMGVSRMTVYRALRFEGSSETGAKIRKLAYELGGQLVGEAPVEETIHDAEGKMTQRFLNGATLVVNKKTGSVTVTDRDGRVRATSRDVALRNLAKMQKIANEL